MSSLLGEAEPPVAGQGARRVAFMAVAAALTGFLAWLAFCLGAWGFDYRRYSQHNGRLQRLMSHEPRLDQVTQALKDEGGLLLASPDGEEALRSEVALLGGERAAAVIENGRRYPHTRVFRAGDMIYFIHFDDKGVMRAFTCVSR
jgi:hypothetical protein